MNWALHCDRAVDCWRKTTTVMDFQLKSVLISDDVDQQCVDILSSGGIQVVKNTKLTKDQLKAEIEVIRH